MKRLFAWVKLLFCEPHFLQLVVIIFTVMAFGLVTKAFGQAAKVPCGQGVKCSVWTEADIDALIAAAYQAGMRKGCKPT